MNIEHMNEISSCLEDSNAVIEELLILVEKSGISLVDIELGSGIDLSGTIIRNERMIDDFDLNVPRPNNYDDYSEEIYEQHFTSYPM